jgi:hypothetical protein
MRRNFLFAWAIYWTVAAISPVQSIYPNIFAALSIQVGFVCLVIFSHSLVVAILPTSRMPTQLSGKIIPPSLLIKISLLMALIGFSALLYDKIYVQGIDFSHGLAVAREAWREKGIAREGGASSVFSVIGYLLGSSYYVTVVLIITQAQFLSTRERLLGLFTSFVFVMANSAITGGRSNLLLLATFFVGAFSSRSDVSLRNLFPQKFQLRTLKLLALLAGAYSVFIFYQRAQAGGQEPVDYALDFLPYLGLQPQKWFRYCLNNNLLSSLSSMLVLTASYLTHSLDTTAAIFSQPSEGKSIVFLYAAEISHKLGLTGAPEEDWFLAGRFPSVPGAFWYQFGFVGFIISSLFLGFISAVAKLWVVCKPRSILGLGFYVSMESTLLLSPLLLAEDFLGFPFALASFVMLAVVAAFWRFLDSLGFLGRSKKSYPLKLLVMTCGDEVR